MVGEGCFFVGERVRDLLEGEECRLGRKEAYFLGENDLGLSILAFFKNLEGDRVFLPTWVGEGI
jgi:hypothetical protein